MDMSYDLRGQRVLLQARSLNNVLYVVRQRLVEMKEGLSHTVQDVQHFESVLKDIDNRWRKEGVFAKDVQEFDARMQAHCSTLFNQCFDLVTELKVTSAPMDDNMRLIFDRLCGVRKRLADLRCHQFTYADLLPLQEELDDIDNTRVDGVFGGTVQEGVPKGQAVCSELLNDNYSAIEDMVDSATDMAAATRAIYTNLCGIRNALLRLKNSKHHTFEELRHYQNMLDAIDSRRVDGVFGGSIKDGDIPAGQAACSEMLAKCYGLVEELKNNASEMTPAMQHIYSTLCSLHGNLKAMLKQPHSFDSVRRIQGQLDAIDGAREDGVFAGSLKDGNVPDGQATCSTLLYQCYRLVQKLYNYASDEPPAGKHAAVAGENVPVNVVNA